MNLLDVGALVVANNDADSLERCLASVADCREIVVIDEFSVDATGDVARRFGAVVYQRPTAARMAQFAWGLSRMHSDFVLALAAHEAPDTDLLEHLREIDPDRAAYVAPRVQEYLGSRVRRVGRMGESVTLAKRTAAADLSSVVARPGAVGILAGSVVTFPFRTVQEHIEALRLRACWQLPKHHSTLLATLAMLFAPPGVFVREYVLRGGFMDGARGFIYCLISSYGSFMNQCTAWEKAAAAHASRALNTEESV